MKTIKSIAQELPLNKVKAFGKIQERIEATWQGNVCKLNLEKDFLESFIQKQEKGGFIGIGKHMCAVVQSAYYQASEEALGMKNKIFDIIIKYQEDDGYIGNHVKEKRSIQSLWEYHEIPQIIWALCLDFIYFGEQNFLDAAKKAADYLIKNLPSDFEPENFYIKAGNTFVGYQLPSLDLDRAMLELYEITSDEKYYEALRKFGLLDWNMDIVLGRGMMIEGHVYAYIAHSMAQLLIYEKTGDRKHFLPSEKALNFLLKKGGFTISGGVGIWECWHNNQKGDGQLGETCATAYIIEWLGKLFGLEGNVIYLDIMERMIYNALFAAQSPDGRKLRYYTALQGPREYFSRDTYCCPNNFRWIMSKLPSFIYYRYRSGILVNLFERSEAEINCDDEFTVRIVQETNYPADGVVKIKVFPSSKKRFPLYIRRPGWCKGIDLTLNGKKHNIAYENDIIIVDRNFEEGDEIVIDFHMEWRCVKGFRKQFGRVAVMKGPVLYSASEKNNEILEETSLHCAVIDTANIEEITDKGHLACTVKAQTQKGIKRIKLNEFSDPDGVATYFIPRSYDAAVEDELLDYNEIRTDPEKRRISGFVPAQLNIDDPDAEWDGPYEITHLAWNGQ